MRRCIESFFFLYYCAYQCKVSIKNACSNQCQCDILILFSSLFNPSKFLNRFTCATIYALQIDRFKIDFIYNFRAIGCWQICIVIKLVCVRLALHRWKSKMRLQKQSKVLVSTHLHIEWQTMSKMWVFFKFVIFSHFNSGLTESLFWTTGRRVDSTMYWFATGTKLNFTNWGQDEPYNRHTMQECVGIYAQSEQVKLQWTDVECNESLRIICENDEFWKSSAN